MVNIRKKGEFVLPSVNWAVSARWDCRERDVDLLEEDVPY